MPGRWPRSAATTSCWRRAGYTPGWSAGSPGRAARRGGVAGAGPTRPPAAWRRPRRPASASGYVAGTRAARKGENTSEIRSLAYVTSAVHLLHKDIEHSISEYYNYFHIL